MTRTCREAGCGERTYHRGRCKAHHVAWHLATYSPGVVTPKPKRADRLPPDPRVALLAQYGLTPADYDRMHEEQNGLCRICLRPEPVPGRLLAVDHCHSTGVVRGLLCGDCNRGIGMFKDDPLRLLRAVEYLTGDLS